MNSLAQHSPERPRERKPLGKLRTQQSIQKHRIHCHGLLETLKPNIIRRHLKDFPVYAVCWVDSLDSYELQARNVCSILFVIVRIPSQRLWTKTHKMLVGHAPAYIDSLLTPASLLSLRSSSNCDLVVPRTSRKTGDRAFSVAAPRALNRLPTDLKLLRSTASFKSKLESFLFHAAYTGNTNTLCELWNAPSVWL